MRLPRAIVQLRRAQLILMLAVLVPTILLTGVGIVLLVIGSQSALNVLAGVLVLLLTTSAITGYILGALFVGKGASLARVQNDFLSSVSHELRTPLTSIRLFIDSLRHGKLSAEEQAQVLTLLGGELGRLETLVGRLLELSRMESGRHPFERDRVSIEDIVRDALDIYDASTLSNPTPVLTDLDAGLVVVGDRPTLARAVANLLINAWKYTGDDKRIVLEAREVRKGIEIIVSDNGIGIRRAEQRGIFDEFTRGQQAVDGGLPGVGLGLAFVRAVARAHHGKVFVTSHEGNGSRFGIRLPRGRLDRLHGKVPRNAAVDAAEHAPATSAGTTPR